MKKSIMTFLILILASSTYCQSLNSVSKLNLGFENTDKETSMGRDNFGSSNYIVSLDTNNRKSGKYAASIKFKEGNPEFKAWGFTIPDNYAGKKITPSGFIKTEMVTDGYAGLYMRIDHKCVHKGGIL